MRIVWLPKAASDFDDQIAYLEQRNPTAALHMGDAVDRSLARIGSYPKSAPPGRVSGSRELMVPGTPYVLIYRLRRDMIVVLRFLHGAQRRPGKL